MSETENKPEATPEEKHPLEETVLALARIKELFSKKVESLEIALTQQTEATANLNERLTAIEIAFQAATTNAVKDIESFLQRIGSETPPTAPQLVEENPAVIE